MTPKSFYSKHNLGRITKIIFRFSTLLLGIQKIRWRLA